MREAALLEEKVVEDVNGAPVLAAVESRLVEPGGRSGHGSLEGLPYGSKRIGQAVERKSHHLSPSLSLRRRRKSQIGRRRREEAAIARAKKEYFPANLAEATWHSSFRATSSCLAPSHLRRWALDGSKATSPGWTHNVEGL